MHSLAERVLAHIRRYELLRAGDRVGVAVSGGIDSVALLRLLLELRDEVGIVLSVVHFNHRLRGAESDADEQFVAELARHYDLEFFVDSDDVAERAREDGVSVETAAREVRYGFFRYLLGSEESPSGAEAQVHMEGENRSAEGTAPPKRQPHEIQSSNSDPQGLKPDSSEPALRGPEGPLFHGAALDIFHGAALDIFHGAALDIFHGAAPDKGRALDKVVTGHTLDDQAETVLMRLIRGAGLRGLGGIYPQLAVENESGEVCGEIIRPLLSIRRRELQQYLNDIGQPWREDSTNADDQFTRNRVRKLVVPLLEREFNPAVAENLAELAEIARGEEDYWENEISGWMGTGVHWSEPTWVKRATSNLVQIDGAAPQGLKPQPREESQRGPEGPLFHGAPELRGAPWLVMNASVDLMWFLSEPIAVQRRMVKAIGENAGIPLEFKHVEEILRLAAEDGPSGKELSLPMGWKLRREPDELIFTTPDLRESTETPSYEYELSIPGRTVIHETTTALEVHRISAGDAGYNPDQLLDIESLPGRLRVRNWRAGERFWPAHTKSPKKIKELLQERHVAPPERRLWPVVVSGDEIVWMRGFATPAKLRAKPGHDALLILEKPLVNGAAK